MRLLRLTVFSLVAMLLTLSHLTWASGPPRSVLAEGTPTAAGTPVSSGYCLPGTTGTALTGVLNEAGFHHPVASQPSLNVAKATVYCVAANANGTGTFVTDQSIYAVTIIGLEGSLRLTPLGTGEFGDPAAPILFLHFPAGAQTPQAIALNAPIDLAPGDMVVIANTHYEVTVTEAPARVLVMGIHDDENQGGACPGGCWRWP